MHVVRVAAIGLALAVTACSGTASRSSYGAGDPNLAAPLPGTDTIDPFLSNGQAVLAALDAIEARSGKPLRVTSITADQGNGLMVDVQEPAHPINVDHYVVGLDGSLSGPTPVKLMSLNGGPITAQSVDAQAFDPRAIAFAHLAATIREGIERSGYADARVTQWEFDGLSSDSRDFIYFESARARPAANVNSQLRIVHMSF